MLSALQKDVVDALCASGISDGWKNFLRSSKPGIIYGAGRQATVVYDFCCMLGKKCHCLVAAESRNRWGLLPGEDALSLYLLDEVPAHWNKDDFDVIIAVNPVHNAEIAQNLAARGWQHVMCSKDWEADNAATRDVFYRAYLCHQGARLCPGKAEGNVLEYNGPRGFFKIHFDIDSDYKGAMLGDLNNIILPSVFNDQSLLGAYGPYEFGVVQLKAGDTVFDLGANIGMFSCVAASMGCKVHAFEPTQRIVDQYLSKNASLYDTIVVNSCAVMHAEGVYPFYINGSFEESRNITRHSMFRELEPRYQQIEVSATTIDEYVRSKGIEKVDFIKSHTEYSELNLLRGAQQTLAKFSPRLALTATNTDQLVQVILNANPRYVFYRDWYRLFGWVE